MAFAKLASQEAPLRVDGVSCDACTYVTNHGSLILFGRKAMGV